MIPVKWVMPRHLYDKYDAPLEVGLYGVPVVELAAMTEVVKGLQRINDDMLAAGFDAPTQAQRLLDQLEDHTTGGGDE